MVAERDDDATRRTVVPAVAGRSLWLAAAWTGVGAAVACATVAIVVVAICWLPVSGTSGHSASAIKAGLLGFLAALHGGITVDGTAAAFVPLGMTIAVGLTAWRAGSGLADAAGALDERDPFRLALAGLTQLAGFAITCLLAVPFATLGTSDVPLLGVGAAAILLFAVTGGIAFIRSSELSGWCAERVPPLLACVARAAAAAVAVYLGMGAVLVAGSVVVHRGQIEALSRQVGGGWSGVPILILGVLAAPNAVIAGAAYLAGPGFAVGSGSTASVFGTAHGVLPTFPILGAVPTGHGAAAAAWWLVVATPLLAGLAVARLAYRAPGWLGRLGAALRAAAGAGLAMGVLAWQGGGGVGDGRLHTVGASWWQLGLAVAGAVAVAATLALAGIAAWRWIDSADAPGLATLLAARDDDSCDRYGDSGDRGDGYGDSSDDDRSGDEVAATRSAAVPDEQNRADHPGGAGKLAG